MSTENVIEAENAIRSALEKANDEEATSITHAMVANALATLALVEQQRIANLIALSTPQSLIDGAEASLPSWDAQYQLRADIREGLGL